MFDANQIYENPYEQQQVDTLTRILETIQSAAVQRYTLESINNGKYRFVYENPIVVAFTLENNPSTFQACNIPFYKSNSKFSVHLDADLGVQLKNAYLTVLKYFIDDINYSIVNGKKIPVTYINSYTYYTIEHGLLIRSNDTGVPASPYVCGGTYNPKSGQISYLIPEKVELCVQLGITR